MAKADNISVAVESIIHNALREAAQIIFDEHKIRVDNVSFSWIDVSEVSRLNFIVDEVEVQTTTKGGPCHE